MAKVIRGSAGKMLRREEILDRYGTNLATLIIKSLGVDPTARIIHIGSPGAVQLIEAFAPALTTGEITVVVFTYDELEEARAALAGLGNVAVINELDDLDPDELPYDVLTCIIPYQMRRDDIDELLARGLRLVRPQGQIVLAGDRQQGFDRYVTWLQQSTGGASPLSHNGQLRIVTAPRPERGGTLRPSTA